MEITRKNLNWLCFSGLSDAYPIWRMRFQAFCQTKGLFETMTADDVLPNSPRRLPDGASDEQSAADDAATEAYMNSVADIEKRNNTLWCYFAMVLNSTSLIIIRHYCEDNKGLGNGHKIWTLLQQRFRSDETMPVVSVMPQLAHLPLKEHKAQHNYFIRAQELSTRLEDAEEHLPKPLLNAMVFNGLPERYEHFVVQESFNPAGGSVELRTRLMNYEESRQHLEYVDDVDSHMAMMSKKARPKQNSSSKYNAPPKSSSRQLICFCCGIKRRMKSECF